MKFKVGTVVGSTRTPDGKWESRDSNKNYVLVRGKTQWDIVHDDGTSEEYMSRDPIQEVDTDVDKMIRRCDWKILSKPKNVRLPSGYRYYRSYHGRIYRVNRRTKEIQHRCSDSCWIGSAFNDSSDKYPTRTMIRTIKAQEVNAGAIH